MRSRLFLLALAQQLHAVARELQSFAATAKTADTAHIFVRHAALFEQDAKVAEQQAEALKVGEDAGPAET